MPNETGAEFESVLEGLRRGDFSRLAPFFERSSDADGRSKIVAWHEQGRFDGHPDELAEALTCACFLGAEATAAWLLSRGLDPSGGRATGFDAIHCAASRGELATTRLLLRHRVPLEFRNQYGSTPLGQTIWSAIHQPHPGQREAIVELLRAGADVKAVDRPTGDAEIDELLRRFGAT